jgi:ATP-dependent helicase/nuclease subunit B
LSARVFNIPAGAPFADLLARALIGRLCPTPEALADALILLPTRRALRALRESFLREAGGRPLLLPRLEAIGDADDDELLLHADADPPTPIGALQRRAVLTELVRRRPDIDGDPVLASRLATALAQLLDSAALEEVDLRRLDDIVPGELAAHWQSSLEILAVLREAWPAYLATAGLADPAARRVQGLRARIAAWKRDPPRGLVVAAGSTGSIPATADLLGLVARLPQGVLVLPGLDTGLDDESWSAAAEDPAHPQHGLARLLARIEVPRGAVQAWPEASAPHPRVRLLGEALRPAATASAWSVVARPGSAAFAGLRRIDAPTQAEEALAIALVMRETLETPARTAALITPDRGLARRVSAELRRWELTVDDSGGVPLLRTPPGAFLRLTAAMALDAGAPVAWLAALKHPFACAGMARGRFLSLVRRLERRVLRGLRPGAGIAGLRAAAAVANGPDAAALVAFVDHLAPALAPFAEGLAAAAIAPAALLERHVAFMEWLATPVPPEESRLWAGDAGTALRERALELAAALAPLGPIAGASWPGLLEELLGDEVVRARHPTHPRLSIWGPLEARLQTADVIVLGGLNEGGWPPEIGDDPWLSRPMRKTLGLPPAERRIGLSAHDFVQAASGREVVLATSRKIDGVPSAASRWLQRLDAFLGAHPAWTAAIDHDRLAWAAALDAPQTIVRPRRPAPRPPVALRPARLAVTDIETLVRDPYAVFARRVLGLRPLDGLDEAPDGGDRGNAVHAALRDLLQETGGTLPVDAEARLLDLGRRHFAPLLDRPIVRAIWWPRFERLARWFVAWERRRRIGGLAPLAVEIAGEVPVGAGFTLQARADRIDRLVDGRLGIVDYKTGRVPSGAEIAAGFAPQLPLEAVIAMAGGFAGVEAREVGELLHLRLTGGEPAGEAETVRGMRERQHVPLDTLIAETRAGLERLVARYADPGMAYLARPRMRFVGDRGDYDHLARVAEWSAEGDES